MATDRQSSLTVSLVVFVASAGLASGAAGCKEERQAKVDVQPPRVASLGAKPSRRANTKETDEAPFHLLRYELESSGKGNKSLLRYQISAAIATRVGATTVLKPSYAKKTETIETGLAVSADAPKAGEALQLGVVGLPGSGPDEIIARYRQTIANTRIVATIDDRGQLVGIGGAVPLHKKREAAAFLLRFLVPLPAEEVGLGARWKVKYAIARGGVYIAQTRSYELTKLEGKQLTVNVSINESAEPQPMVEDGTLLGSLIALKLESSGSLVVDLEHPTVRTGQQQERLTLHAKVQGDQEVFRESDSTVSIVAAESKPQ